MSLDHYDVSKALEGPGNTISYTDNRAYSDRFLTRVKQILGPYVLREATKEEDCKQATDLRVLATNDDFRIGVRIRRPGYADKYGHQFTIRSNPAPTEYQKIRDGWGDWLFYGHAKDDQRLALWWIISLDHWRQAVADYPDFDSDGDIPNSDVRGTHLRAYNVPDLVACVGKGAVIASSHPLESIVVPPPARRTFAIGGV